MWKLMTRNKGLSGQLLYRQTKGKAPQRANAAPVQIQPTLQEVVW